MELLTKLPEAPKVEINEDLKIMSNLKPTSEVN